MASIFRRITHLPVHRAAMAQQERGGAYQKVVCTGQYIEEMERMRLTMSEFEKDQKKTTIGQETGASTQRVEQQNKDDEMSKLDQQLQRAADLEQKLLQKRITDDLEKVLAESETNPEGSLESSHWKPRAYLRKLTFPTGFQEFNRGHPRDSGFQRRYRHSSTN